MKFFSGFCFLLILIVCQLILATAGDIYGTAVVDLPENCYTELYNDADVERYVFKDYSPLSRPILNASQPIGVSFTIIFERIVDMFEKERMILVEAYLIVEWKNELINWQHVYPINCSKKLIAPSNKVWIPDISVANAPEDKYSLLLVRGHKIEITYDGICDFYPSGVFNATCSMNLRYFPYDEQICKLRFAPWSYSSEMQQLHTSNSPIDFDHFEQHEQWQLERWEAVNVRTINPADKKTYDEVEIILHLKRKPGFFLVTLVIPIMIISIAEMTIFGLPTTDSHKIYISFTALLAFGFFQLMMVEEIPRDSGHALPILSIYLDLIMAYIGCVLVGESVLFILLKRADPQRPAPPKWLMKPITNVARLIGIKHLMNRTKSSQNRQLIIDFNSEIWTSTSNSAVRKQQSSDAASDAGECTGSLVPLFEQFSRFAAADGDGDDDDGEKDGNNSMKKEQQRLIYGNKMYQRSWLLIAQVLDRLFFTTYIAVLVMTPIAIFVIMPPYEPAIIGEE